MAGVVESINTAPEKSVPTHDVERITVLPNRGPEGDRKFRPAEDPNRPGDGRDLTLVEAEAVEGLAEDTGIVLEPRETRRNVVTRGIGLNDLVGKRFRVGAIECYGVEPCHPCNHLEKLTQPGVLKGLAGRGGLSADVLAGGEIAVGDPVEVLG
jgi:MOSC domain-containing protein YiiM